MRRSKEYKLFQEELCIYNIEADPREIQDVAVSGNAWVMAVYGQLVAKYKATLKDHPNPPAPNLTKF